MEGRTQDAFYAELQSLSFDLGKDDIEEFITEVKNIASQLKLSRCSAGDGDKVHVIHQDLQHMPKHKCPG